MCTGSVALAPTAKYNLPSRHAEGKLRKNGDRRGALDVTVRNGRLIYLLVAPTGQNAVFKKDSRTSTAQSETFEQGIQV